ncbi:MAG: NUDIX domain-containing protein [bacterium]|jgi:acetyl-CoA carboxylase carboxyl transferase subunit beta|nr:NUDIX domain-containing protein [Planctomycetota bacterium]HIL51110.1 NUDIX domain-containing protein [Planctomycetota bacterium]
MWIKRAKFCPVCQGGLELSSVGGRKRLRCVVCGCVLYENPASAAAAVILDKRRRVLLIRRDIAPFEGLWALPAGYQEIDEDPRQAAVREALEETGLEIQAGALIDLLYIPDDPRKPANLAVFLCSVVAGELCPGDDAREVAWFALDALPADMGFDNRERILLPLHRDPGRFGLG